nr:hypothetical protein Iba_scaffold661102CG0010 [Ipomoea batatas]
MNLPTMTLMESAACYVTVVQLAIGLIAGFVASGRISAAIGGLDSAPSRITQRQMD